MSQHRYDNSTSSHGAVHTPTSFRRSGDLAFNLTLLAALWLAYSSVRNLTAARWSDALENARFVLDFQASLGLPSELTIQHFLLDQTFLVKAANTYYMTAHFPTTIACLGYFWLRRRRDYTSVRQMFITATAAGLIVHVLYPLAPPRMLPGFVDTAAIWGPNPYSLSVAAFANQIAAMPSMHVSWALLVSIAVASTSSAKLAYAAFLHPLLTVAAVIVTANHFWSDAIVGAALAGLAWIISRRVRSPRQVEPSSSAEPAPQLS